ncbi:MAG: selenoneine biosynthesis selenosugar synthase SenB [Burkholderiales bacterium]
MARIVIVTPTPPGSRTGNRHTAARWASMLRSAGHRVAVLNEWNGERCDLLIALHADRSHASVRHYKDARPDGALIVILTGTDLYRDLPRGSKKAKESLDLADRIIVLQSEAKRTLPKKWRKKTSVVYQSSDTKLKHAPPARPFRIAVVGHLRKVKDPFRAVMALRHLKGDYQVVQLGAALDPAMAPIARKWMKREPRYRWLGSLPHAEAMKWIARSHALVVSSVMEGGANVICEAARIGTPVLASRVPGNVGMLGADYPGYYRLYDDQALADLIRKASSESGRYKKLSNSLNRRKPQFSPSAEKSALLARISHSQSLDGLR